MKRTGMWGAGISVLTTMIWALTTPGAKTDPYAALRLYEGHWEVQVSEPEKKVDQLENHCALTGLFFSCEQKVNGKSSALVVFLPIEKMTDGAQEYRTQALLADASKAGEWGHLVIDGDTWVYSWEGGDEKKPLHWKNTNHFTGRNKIHFEVQNSEDGSTWKTTMAGDEQRQR